MKNAKFYVIFLMVLSSFLLFWKLGEGSLAGADEAVYAQMAKEVWRFGDWFTMHFNRTPRFIKPPLYVWLTTLNYNFLGINEFTTRFWSAFFAVLGILSLYFLGKKLFDKETALLSSFILLTTVGYFAIGRQAMLSTALTSFIILTILFFCYGQVKSKYFILAGVFLGLAVMTKSAIGLLPVIIIGFFLITTRGLKKILKERNFYFGILAFLMIAGPWHIAHLIIDKNEFVNSYILGTLIQGLGSESRFQGFSFYPLTLSYAFFPWIIFAIFAFAAAIKNVFKKKGTSAFILLLYWITLPFIIFLFGKEKLDWYLVPIYPALALLTAHYIKIAFSTRKGIFISFLLLFIISLLSGSILLVLQNKHIVDSKYISSLFVLFAGFALSSVFYFTKKTFLPFIIIIASLLIFAFSTIYPLKLYDFAPYNKALALKMKEISEPQDKITFYKSRSVSLLFYSDRFTLPVIKEEKELFKYLDSGEKVFCVIKEEDFKEIKEKIQNFNLTVIYPEVNGFSSPFKVDKRILLVKN